MLSEIGTGLKLPEACVKVLSPVRTFWEKSTLVHVECHRGRIKDTPDRLSRHWYDLVCLGNSWVGDEALKERSVLEDVVSHKITFFNAAYANYDMCLSGNIRLIPDQDGIKALESDYRKMQDSGMFSENPPQFKELISNLRELELRMNQL